MQATHPALGAARIGPNAIIQTVGALEELHGREEARRLLFSIGRGDLTEQLPTAMIDEGEFVALIAGLRNKLGLVATGQILGRSGERTAAYLLAHRIPAPARAILPLLPNRLGLNILLKAITAHAWTFAGTGRFSYSVGKTTTLRLEDCPECRGITATAPLCRYYESCFQALLRPLIDKRLTVRETVCAAQGGDTCIFVVQSLS